MKAKTVVSVRCPDCGFIFHQKDSERDTLICRTARCSLYLREYEIISGDTVEILEKQKPEEAQQTG